jgi:hypothetical protein
LFAQAALYLRSDFHHRQPQPGHPTGRRDVSPRQYLPICVPSGVNVARWRPLAGPHQNGQYVRLGGRTGTIFEDALMGGRE